MRDLYVGIDIGGTKTSIGIFSPQGTLLSDKKIRTRIDMPCEAFVRTISGDVREMLVSLDAGIETVAFAGAGVPGTVDESGSTVLYAPNLSWRNEPVKRYFQSHLGLEVMLEQDTRAAAWGEYLYGAGKGLSSIVCVTIGTGIGAGIIIAGKIYKGALLCAGEIGHMPVHPRGRKCNCSRSGCLEAYASGTAIRRQGVLAFNDPDMTTERVFDLALRRNGKALAIIEEAVAYLSMGIISVINILSPEAVVLSGGLCAQETLVIEPLTRAVMQGGYPIAVNSERFKIVRAELAGDAPLYGAGMLFKSK